MNATIDLGQLEPVDILLVEDNPDDAELTLRSLRRRHVMNRVVVVPDGEAAIEYLLDEGHALPRIVLLDLKLPKIGGIEVLRWIRANERTRRLAVVVLSSSTLERDITEAYELGVNSFVAKPVEFDEFQAAVERLGMYWILLNRVPGQPAPTLEGTRALGIEPP
jgi:CheY-like chemotaxis protein